MADETTPKSEQDVARDICKAATDAALTIKQTLNLPATETLWQTVKEVCRAYQEAVGRLSATEQKAASEAQRWAKLKEQAAQQRAALEAELEELRPLKSEAADLRARLDAIEGERPEVRQQREASLKAQRAKRVAALERMVKADKPDDPGEAVNALAAFVRTMLEVGGRHVQLQTHTNPPRVEVVKATPTLTEEEVAELSRLNATWFTE